MYKHVLTFTFRKDGESAYYEYSHSYGVTVLSADLYKQIRMEVVKKINVSSLTLLNHTYFKVVT